MIFTPRSCVLGYFLLHWSQTMVNWIDCFHLDSCALSGCPFLPQPCGGYLCYTLSDPVFLKLWNKGKLDLEEDGSSVQPYIWLTRSSRKRICVFCRIPVGGLSFSHILNNCWALLRMLFLNLGFRLPHGNNLVAEQEGLRRLERGNLLNELCHWRSSGTTLSWQKCLGSKSVLTFMLQKPRFPFQGSGGRVVLSLWPR